MNTNITKRLLLLIAIVLVGMSSVFLLPKNVKRLEPGVVLKLPDFVDDWFGQDIEVGKGERDILGAETQFARKRYTNGRGDSIFVSVVISGEDMSASIHRPERCLPAQGYTIANSHPLKIECQSRPFTVTRLCNMRQVDSNGKPYIGAGNKPINELSLIYYWFVGSDEMTSDHMFRYLLDIRDRLLKGAYQPWAYVTVMSNITGSYDKNGRTEEQTDAMLQDFVKQVIPKIQKPCVELR